MGLGEVVGVGAFAVAEDGCEGFCAAFVRIGSPLENDNPVTFGEFHTLAIAREWSKGSSGDETKGIEAGVGVFADGVVSAGDDQVEVAGLEHGDGKGDG